MLDWDGLPESKRSSYLSALGAQHPPAQMSLYNGLKLLEVLTSSFPPETDKDIKDIMSIRNYSYLEHGYDKVSGETAQKILKKMEKTVTNITSIAGIKKNPLECAEELRLDA